MGHSPARSPPKHISPSVASAPKELAPQGNREAEVRKQTYPRPSWATILTNRSPSASSRGPILCVYSRLIMLVLFITVGAGAQENSAYQRPVKAPPRRRIRAEGSCSCRRVLGQVVLDEEEVSEEGSQERPGGAFNTAGRGPPVRSGEADRRPTFQRRICWWEGACPGCIARKGRRRSGPSASPRGRPDCT